MSDHPDGNDPGERDGQDQQDQQQGAADHDDRSGGEVSEVSAMDPSDADTPISDSQSVAGQPNDESGEVQDGPAGPNAIPDHERPRT